MRLDGCWFQEEKAPPCPHHPFCHCTLDLIPYAVVFGNVSVYSDYGKFDPYLFNTTGLQTHNKEKLFKEWGYTIDDARWLWRCFFCHRLDGKTQRADKTEYAIRR